MHIRHVDLSVPFLLCRSIDSSFPPSGNVLLQPLAPALHPLHHNPPQPNVAPDPAPPAHRPIRRPLRPQNPRLPLPVRLLLLQPPLLDRKGLPDLLHRAQRAGAERSLRAPHQELRGERSDRVAEREDLWEGEAGGSTAEIGRGRGRGEWRKGQGSNDRGGLPVGQGEEGLYFLTKMMFSENARLSAERHQLSPTCAPQVTTRSN
jgi:hypothetical protein